MAAAAAGRRIALLDIPLLFEVGARSRGSTRSSSRAPRPRSSGRRLLARPGMDEGRADAMIARQIPDAEKRRRAHFIIDTGASLADTSRAVADLVRAACGARRGAIAPGEGGRPGRHLARSKIYTSVWGACGLAPA